MKNKQFGCEDLNPAELQQVNGGGLLVSIGELFTDDVVKNIFDFIVKYDLAGDDFTLDLLDNRVNLVFSKFIV